MGSWDNDGKIMENMGTYVTFNGKYRVRIWDRKRLYSGFGRSCASRGCWN